MPSIFQIDSIDKLVKYEIDVCMIKSLYGMGDMIHWSGTPSLFNQ